MAARKISLLKIDSLTEGDVDEMKKTSLVTGRPHQYWRSLHRHVLFCIEKGWTPKQICEKFKLQPIQYYKITNNSNFIAKRDKIEDAVDKRIVEEVIKVTVQDKVRLLFERNLTKAAKTVVDICKNGNPNDKIRFEAAKEILYQSGLKPVDVVETRERLYTPEEIESAHDTAKEVEQIFERLTGNTSKYLVSDERTEATSEPMPAIEDKESPNAAEEQVT